MSSRVHYALNKGLINPPSWLPHNTMFEGWTGSVAYGASNDSSDMDIVGFCIPPKDVVFPHLGGHIIGFGQQPDKFRVWQQHHIEDKGARTEYDFSIYNIVDFFDLAKQNNPNMVDNLFLPRRCVLHSTDIYEYVREHRREFLHKGSYHKFRGYAASQMSKINKGSNKSNPKRQKSIDEFGYDVKFAYHVVRLYFECEQILTTGDLRLDRDSQVYQSIRRGEWSLERLNEWAEEKDRSMETLYAESKLPDYPNEKLIKEHLLHCLEMHYGSLDAVISKEKSTEALVRELQDLVRKYE